MMATASSLPPVVAGDFAGPLDLLLDEVRRQNVALEEISMAPIVARFLEYVHTAAKRNLNFDIEWLWTAATLIQWKSRSLLPRDPAGLPELDPIRDDLIAQLRAHRKDAAEELGRAPFARTSPLRATREWPQSGGRRPGGSGGAALRERLGPHPTSPRSRLVDPENRATVRHWRETFDVEAETVTVAERIEWLRGQLAQPGNRARDALPLLEEQPGTPGRALPRDARNGAK